MIKSLARDSRIRVASTLLLVWLLAVWHLPAERQILGFFYPLLALVTVLIADVLITFIRYRKWYVPAASLVTGFLIGLIIAPTEPFWVIIAAGLGASISKQFTNLGIRQHIFNPAAFGIMATSLILGTAVSWWGVAWSRLPLIILVPSLVWILLGLRRLFLPVGFLVVYFGYLLTKFAPLDAAESLIDGSLLLFAMVMLPEPITSPARGKFKYLFGAGVALLTIGLSTIGKLTEVFLPALLLANLVGFAALRLTKKRT